MRPLSTSLANACHVDESIRRLTEQGETDFQVNLVVLGLDGKPKPNALWMDAVSLNFKD